MRCLVRSTRFYSNLLSCILEPKISRKCSCNSVKTSPDVEDEAKLDESCHRKIVKRKEGISHSEANFEETDYYFENGLRKVYPYYYTYHTYCKERWAGGSVLDVYSTEFGELPVEEYAKRILKGYLLVNGEKVDLNYKLKHMDELSSAVHRHELPVLARRIKVVHDSGDVIAIEKPPSLPVHPCGPYRHNSVLFVLAKENGIKGVYGVHRLDRLTSGLLLFTRTIEKAQEITEEIQRRIVLKTYIARVEGNFPDEEVFCDVPLRHVQGKVGITVVSKRGKYCLTEFKKISYKNGTSVVLCKPYTGRMHQIRVHLQYLGYPIINDPLYNCTLFGPQKGKDGEYGKPISEVINEIHEMQKIKKWSRSTENNLSCSDDDLSKYNFLLGEEYETNTALPNYKKDPERISYDAECYTCRMKLREPVLSDMFICLHAMEYEGTNWKFSSEVPEWASSDWVMC